jgi:hypothetical protein
MQIARSGGAVFDVSGKNARQREIAGESRPTTSSCWSDARESKPEPHFVLKYYDYAAARACRRQWSR